MKYQRNITEIHPRSPSRNSRFHNHAVKSSGVSGVVARHVCTCNMHVRTRVRIVVENTPSESASYPPAVVYIRVHRFVCAVSFRKNKGPSFVRLFSRPRTSESWPRLNADVSEITAALPATPATERHHFRITAMISGALSAAETRTRAI